MSPTQHGTDAAYRRGCRCSWCVEALRLRARDRRLASSLARMFVTAPAWFEQAKCRGWDANVLYPQTNSDRAWERAEASCTGCPVQTDCLDHAIAAGETMGVWGGLRPAARRRLTAARMIGAAR